MELQDICQWHVVPMAQDFHALFRLNDSDKMLDDANLNGVELAAIQALNKKFQTLVKTQSAQMKEKDAEIEELRSTLAEMNARLTGLESSRTAASNQSIPTSR